MRGKSIFKNDFFLVILILILFQPDYFKTINTIDILYLFLSVISMIFIISKYLAILKVPKFSIWVLAFYFPMYVSTLYYGQDIIYALRKTILCIVVIMLCEIGLFYKGKDFLFLVANVIIILLVLNAVSFIFFPDGMVTENMNMLNDKIYFLTSKNGMISWCIYPLLIYLEKYFTAPTKKSRYQLYCVYIIVSINILYTGSSTGIIGWGLCVIFYFIYRYNINIKFTIKSIIAFVVVIFFAIIIFRIQHKFMFVFDVIFGEKVTFSGREWIWDQAINYIKQSPIIGYGMREKTLIITHYGRYYSSHNFILETLINGGICSLIVFAFMLVSATKRNKLVARSKGFRVYLLGLVVFAVCTLTESPLHNFKWWLPIFLVYDGYMICNKEIIGNKL